MMACPFPDCRHSDAKINVRYGSREVECPSCGKFKMTDKLFEIAAGTFASRGDSLSALREFIQARNSEGKIPMLTDENWEMLAAEQGRTDPA